MFKIIRFLPRLNKLYKIHFYFLRQHSSFWVLVSSDSCSNCHSNSIHLVVSILLSTSIAFSHVWPLQYVSILVLWWINPQKKSLQPIDGWEFWPTMYFVQVAIYLPLRTLRKVLSICMLKSAKRRQALNLLPLYLINWLAVIGCLFSSWLYVFNSQISFLSFISVFWWL